MRCNFYYQINKVVGKSLKFEKSKSYNSKLPKMPQSAELVPPIQIRVASDPERVGLPNPERVGVDATLIQTLLEDK